MKKIFISIIFIIMVFSCKSEEFVIIKETIYDGDEDITYIEENKINKNKEQVLLTGGKIHNTLIKVEGLEKLSKLKYLWIDFNVENLSYLYYLNDLEILVYLSDKKDVDTDFLYNLKKLKILYIDGLNIKNRKIDFKNNKYLEYVTLANIHTNTTDPYFYLDLLNIPGSLKYIDMSRCAFLIKNKKLLDSIKKVSYIFLGHSKTVRKYEKYENIDENYFIENPNFLLQAVKDVVPEKYWKNTLYSLFEEGE